MTLTAQSGLCPQPTLCHQARALTEPPGLLGVTVGMDSKDPVWEQVLLVPCCWRLAVPPGRGVLGPPSPAGQAAWAQATLPGMFIALGPAAHGSRKPLGPSCSFLNKGPWPLPHAYCIFIKSLLTSCPWSCLMKMWELPATNWKRRNEIQSHHKPY